MAENGNNGEEQTGTTRTNGKSVYSVYHGKEGEALLAAQRDAASSATPILKIRAGISTPRFGLGS